jgi:N-methylhydantoinase A
MAHFVAVDIGGTFTDLVAFDERTSEVRYTKSPTTYGNFVDGIAECLRKVEVAPASVSFVNHGTTLVINALIQREGAKAAMVCTRGFRDVLEIARGNRPDPFDLHYRRDEPLIPREMRFEAGGRIGPQGEEIEPLDEHALADLAGRLSALGVEAIAVSFFNAYANPSHEERTVNILRRSLPGVYVTGGTELSREWYEYERTSTVAANAYVGPSVTGYLGNIDQRLRREGFDGALFMMGSNGGVLSVERSLRQPIALVESGPIGGCIGAGAYAEALGLPNVIAFDMGGTTAKCALVEDGRFSVDQIYFAGGTKYGYPIKSPVIDIIEVGSGGGSIAWLDPQKRLHVGPRSAGSTPGPACYGNGGTEPTVTDANLLLGRIAAHSFLGGEMKLDPAAARQALERRIATPLGYEGEEGVVAMADGILSIATVIMAGAIRRQTVEHGRDPRDFVLFSYGGGGPLHAAALARELSIPTVIVPPEPGNFSACGMLIADARLDASKTYVGVLDERGVQGMAGAFAQLESELAHAMQREIGAAQVVFERFVEMRYRGQRHNIRVMVEANADAARIRDAFDHDYLRRYGHADKKAGVEIQALHLSAFARMKRPELARLARRRAGQSRKASTRAVYFGGSGGQVRAEVYDRFSLEPGFAASGPAIIEEYGSTTVVLPGDRFEVGELGEIRIHCEGRMSA